MTAALPRASIARTAFVGTALTGTALALVGCGTGRSAAGAQLEENLAVMQREEKPELLVDRGKAFAQAGDMTRAEQYFAAALERGADASSVMPLLVRVCVAERRYRVAIDYAEEHLRRHPTDTPLRFLLGSLYLGVGETDTARGHLEQAAREDPKNADVRFALGVLYRDEVEDRAIAHDHFAAYLELAPRGPHAAEARGSLLKTVPSP